MADRCASFSGAPAGNVVDAVALNYSGGDHTPTDIPNGFHCTTAGNLACRLMNASGDVTLAVLAGVYYPYRILTVRQTGSTAAGVFLYTK